MLYIFKYLFVLGNKFFIYVILFKFLDKCVWMKMLVYCLVSFFNVVSWVLVLVGVKWGVSV